MSLYGDLPPPGGEAASETLVAPGGWSRPTMTARQTLPSPSSSSSSATKKKPAFNVPIAFKPRQASLPAGQTVSSTGPSKSGIASTPTVTVETIIKRLMNTDTEQGNSPRLEEVSNSNNVNNGPAASFDVEDPYDPARPNDYLTWCEERLEEKRLAKLAEENSRKLIEIERVRAQLESDRADAIEKGDMQRLSAMGAGRGRGRGLSNLPAWMTAQQESNTNNKNNQMANITAPGGGVKGQFDDHSDIGNVAAKIMSKMGYQEGAGLGREGQGITNPIEHRRSGSGGGGQVVMSESDKERFAGRAPTQTQSQSQSQSQTQGQTQRKRQGLFSNPSCVVLVKNMVGPGEVDDFLAEETKSECLKYGPVNSCIVYEVTSPDCPPDEYVRTFVAFEKQESAVKAYRDLNGRFFGGRQISASFYDEGKFARKELSPAPGEW